MSLGPAAVAGKRLVFPEHDEAASPSTAPPSRPAVSSAFHACKASAVYLVSSHMPHCRQEGWLTFDPSATIGHRAPSPGATNGNFASNNPFRRGVSPVQPPPTLDSSRPKMSNNPFLDPPAAPLAVQPQPATQNNPFGGEELFVS